MRAAAGSCSPGRIVPSKGVAVLIEASREVEAEFVICGEGWQLERLRALAARSVSPSASGFAAGWRPRSSPANWPRPRSSRCPRSGPSRSGSSASRRCRCRPAGRRERHRRRRRLARRRRQRDARGTRRRARPGGEAQRAAGRPRAPARYGRGRPRRVAARFSKRHHVAGDPRRLRAPPASLGAQRARRGRASAEARAASELRTAAAVPGRPSGLGERAAAAPERSRSRRSASSSAAASASACGVRPRSGSSRRRSAPLQRRGPSIATTGLPEASEPASVPLREEGPAVVDEQQQVAAGQCVGELLGGERPGERQRGLDAARAAPRPPTAGRRARTGPGAPSSASRAGMPPSRSSAQSVEHERHGGTLVGVAEQPDQVARRRGARAVAPARAGWRRRAPSRSGALCQPGREASQRARKSAVTRTAGADRASTPSGRPAASAAQTLPRRPPIDHG